MKMGTLRIKSTDEPSQGLFVVIDAVNFDPAVHQLFDDAPQASNDGDQSAAVEAADDTPAPRRRGRPPKERM